MNDRLDQSATQPAQTQRFLRKREAVLEAAARVFNQHGVKGATLAEVGRELGLATNSITYYYKRKEDLASACFLRAIEVQTEVAQASAAHPTLRERVAAFIRGSYAIEQAIVLGERPALVSYNEIRALPPSHAAAVFEAYGAMFRMVRRLLEGSVDGAERGLLNARTHLLLSLANSRSLARRVDPADIAMMAERVSDIVLDGIASSRAAWVDEDDAEPRIDARDARDARDASHASHAAAARDATASPGRPTAAGASASPGAAVGPEQDFLRVATQLINEQGFRGASVERISARLNLTKGSFYHHHDNKEDLIGACFERSQATLRNAIAASRAAGGTGWERLSRTARHLVRYQLSAQGPLLRMTAVSALPPARRIGVLQTQDRLNEQLRWFVVDGMIDGSIRPLDPMVAAHLVGSMINAAATLPRWAASLPPDAADRAFARPLLLGIGCPG